MVTDEQIKRINELARKSKTVGLTEKERVEQQALRSEYVQAMRGSLQARLDSIVLVDENGKELGPLTKKNTFKN